MRLTNVIPRTGICFPMSAGSVDQALAELVRELVAAERLPPALEESALLNLMKREAIGPTAVGQGVAVPHTRLAGLETMVGALGVSREGIPFDESPSGRVHAMFLFLAPVWDHEGYLNLLALVSRIVRDGSFVQQALAAETSARLATLLREFEGRIQP